LLYYTIQHPGESKYVEKMSRFLAFAIPIRDAAEARDVIKSYQNEYHDARHVCWAYMLGADRTEYQLNDNGEPSGTAGKPILGQINSANVTDLVVIVVRYFGGIKLGTSGLIAAYREAARLAIADAGIKEMHEMAQLDIEFGYESADKVMRIIKSPDISILDKSFDNLCHARIELQLDYLQEVSGKLSKIENVRVDNVGSNA
jgi:uncharacterized YigZ family protein